MIFKKPVLSSVLLIGILVCAIFASRFLLSFMDDSKLLLAVAETIITVVGLMALFFGAIYIAMKKRFQPDSNMKDVMFNHTGSIAKIPAKGKDPIVIAMNRTR